MWKWSMHWGFRASPQAWYCLSGQVFSFLFLAPPPPPLGGQSPSSLPLPTPDQWSLPPSSPARELWERVWEDQIRIRCTCPITSQGSWWPWPTPPWTGRSTVHLVRNTAGASLSLILHVCTLPVPVLLLGYPWGLPVYHGLGQEAPGKGRCLVQFLCGIYPVTGWRGTWQPEHVCGVTEWLAAAPGRACARSSNIPRKGVQRSMANKKPKWQVYRETVEERRGLYILVPLTFFPLCFQPGATGFHFALGRAIDTAGSVCWNVQMMDDKNHGETSWQLRDLFCWH